MKLPLKPVKPRRIADEVSRQLTELIYRGVIKPGDRLLSERELARQLHVSRPTVREAINKLVAMGLLEQRHGQGTFVKALEDVDQNPLAALMDGEDVSLVDILEVRMGLECNAARLAALRASDADMDYLRASLDEMRRDIAGGGLGHEADISFHMAVSYATRNPVHVRVMRSLYDFLFFGIHMNLQKLYQEPASLEAIIAQHTTVYEAIKSRSAEAAQEAMNHHIQFVLEFFRNHDQ